MMKKVLFICTANSARSQIAEALLKKHGGDQFEVMSAGTSPEAVDPRALEVISKFGADTKGISSKSVDSFVDLHFDYVISLCDKAHLECKNWLGSGVVMAWDFPDPKASNDPNAFAKTLQEINERIRLFVLVNSKKNVNMPLSAPSDFFISLADDIRLKCVLLMDQEGELCVCELVDAIGEEQAKISRHLGLLRKSGLVQSRRQGKWVFYRLHSELAEWIQGCIRVTRENNLKFLDACKARLAEMNARPSMELRECKLNLI